MLCTILNSYVTVTEKLFSFFHFFPISLFFQTTNIILQKCRGNIQPMGGLQIIFTGDFFQLPPVTKTKNQGENNFINHDINPLNFSQGKKSSSISSISSYQSIPNKHPNIPLTGTSGLHSALINSQSEVIESSQNEKSKSQSYCHYDKLVKDYTPAPTHSIKPQQSGNKIDSQKESNNNNQNSNLIQTDKKEGLLYCFQSHIWTQIITSTFVLTNVFRQNEVSFSSLLNSIRCGELTGMYTFNMIFFKIICIYIILDIDGVIAIFNLKKN